MKKKNTEPLTCTSTVVVTKKIFKKQNVSMNALRFL